MTNAWKMMCNNSNLDLININAYTKFGEILSIFPKILSGNEIMRERQTEQSGIDRQPKSSKALLIQSGSINSKAQN